MKERIMKIPIIGMFAGKIKKNLHINLEQKPSSSSFQGSVNYWINRYDLGGNSGPGSSNHLAEFKAEIINDFCITNSISKVLEFGCGDGNQLKLAEYPQYIGFDVSPRAISLCEEIFYEDDTKLFKLMNQYKGETSQLTLSIDVIFHLIEDDVFKNYMDRLFDSSERYVIIYSSNSEDTTENSALHVKHRKFTNWIEENRPSWSLIHLIPNRFPFAGDVAEGSFADFYIYEKVPIL